MKLIIIEGGDNLGKSLLIEGICKHFNYDNIIIRHFGKPPKGLTPKEVLDFQFKCFEVEATRYKKFREDRFNKYQYFEDILIWNRSHLGEYVYSQMFREGDPKELKNKLLAYEGLHFAAHQDVPVHLITLTASPKFFLSKEDGQSFSKNLNQKTQELKLFKEAHEFSLIRDKLLVKVDKNEEFRTKEAIIKQVINFIK